MTDQKISETAKIPKFIRQDIHKKRLAKVWRKPNGRHSKLRLKKKGHQASVSIGYGTPLNTRKINTIIRKPADLDGLDVAKVNLIVPRRLGTKKKIMLIEKLKELNVSVRRLNIEAFLKKIEEEKANRKEKKKVKKDQKKKEEDKGKKVKEDLLEKKISEEEKKEQEHKEKNKLLTKRETK